MTEGSKLPDFQALYQRYQQLKPGPKAELKRVMNPEDLVEIPSFYRVLKDNKAHKGMQRIVYCLPHIQHRDNGDSLGAALAKAGVNEKRLIMVIRSEEPNDLIQLRRLLKQADQPKLDWSKMALSLLRWSFPEYRIKQKLLEDFFLFQKDISKTS